MSATEKRVDEKTNKVLTKGRIEVRFALEQRKNIGPHNDESYKPIMLKLHSFFFVLIRIWDNQNIMKVKLIG